MAQAANDAALWPWHCTTTPWELFPMAAPKPPPELTNTTRPTKPSSPLFPSWPTYLYAGEHSPPTKPAGTATPVLPPQLTIPSSHLKLCPCPDSPSLLKPHLHLTSGAIRTFHNLTETTTL